MEIDGYAPIYLNCNQATLPTLPCCYQASHLSRQGIVVLLGSQPLDLEYHVLWYFIHPVPVARLRQPGVAKAYYYVNFVRIFGPVYEQGLCP